MQAGHIQVELRVDAVTPELLAALAEVIGPGAAEGEGPAALAQPAGNCVELTIDDEELLPAIAERVLASGARLYALTPRRVSLEQLFLEIVGTQDSGQ
jgi:ABC-2 type transport system ATP-binding protein